MNAQSSFYNQVKLYHLNSLVCHGLLIDESWLIASGECFAHNNQSWADSTNDDLKTAAWWPQDGWTAEISHEHYGNADYKSIESNRRAIKSIVVPPSGQQTRSHAMPSPIVLAKLERPVRFR